MFYCKMEAGINGGNGNNISCRTPIKRGAPIYYLLSNRSPPTRMMKMNTIKYHPSRFMMLHGVNVHYELYNEQLLHKQTPLLFIHGFLSSTFSFRKVIPLFAKHYPIIAVDLPPFGKSEKSRHFTYSYESFTAIILALGKELRIPSVVLIGHSMGGQIALQTAKRSPDFIEKLVLLCSSSYLMQSKPALIYSSYLPFFPYYLKHWFKKKGAEQSLYQVVHDHTMIDQEMMDGYFTPFYEKYMFHALTRMIRHREADLSSEELKQIQTSSLLIWGEHDKVVPVRIGKRLAKDLPNSELIVYQQTGHLVPEEKPVSVYRDVQRFLQA